MKTIYYKNMRIDENSPIDEVRNLRQEQNKDAFAKYLAESTVEFNGKQYGVQEEDQNEIQAMIMQYQLLSQAGVETELQWHAKHEACQNMTIEEMIALVSAIKDFVLPHQHRMQEIKEEIFKAGTVSEVMDIEIFSART